MTEIILAHAIETDPGKLWYPDLAARLAGRAKVVIPALPADPSPQTWATTLTDAVTDPTATVLVGHSLGGVALLRLLERHDGAPFAGVVLVATPFQEVGYEPLAPFFAGGFDWPSVRRAALGFRALIAADDPVLVPDPFVHARHYVTVLGAAARITEKGGHYPVWTPDAVPSGLALPEAVALTAELLPRAESPTPPQSVEQEGEQAVGLA